MLKIFHPPTYDPERNWIHHVLFNEFLGIKYASCEDRIDHVYIQHEGRAIKIADTLFSQSSDLWLTKESLPRQPLSTWNVKDLPWPVNVISSDVPLIYGEDIITEISEDEIRLGLDIFGSAFFMLSRYEEAVKTDRDNHNRFPASAAIAYQETFLARPIVNEYVEILWSCIKHLWPGISRKKRSSNIHITVDIDYPYHSGTRNLYLLGRQMVGDVVRRRNPSQAMNSVASYLLARKGNYSRDQYYIKFDWIMDVNEAMGNRVAFYFITEHTDKKLDGYYNIDERIIRSLMKRIYERGHELGLHLSYHAYNDKKQTIHEAEKLKTVMYEEGISQENLGSRQHFLRWVTPDTAINLEAAGIKYDTTLTFADYAGFRCGVCYEYSMYDLYGRKKLMLKERSLVLMEESVLGNKYMGLGYSADAINVMKALKNNCFKFNGDFTLLWHNNHFQYKQDKYIYQRLIEK